MVLTAHGHSRGNCLVVLSESVVVFDHQGILVAETRLDGHDLDDFGYPPNITGNGHLIISCIQEGGFSINSTKIRQFDVGGCDIPTPAVYPDHSLAVSGYSGDGFCRTDCHGELIWRTNFEDADLPLAINKMDIAAVGSVNDASQIFIPWMGN